MRDSDRTRSLLGEGTIEARYNRVRHDAAAGKAFNAQRSRFANLYAEA